MKKLLKNSTGMSLIEVMAAIAITGGLALTISKLMENQSQGVKQNEAKSENMNLKGLVQDTLSNTTACQNTFANITAGEWTSLAGSTTFSVAIPSIKDKLNNPKYSATVGIIAPLTITDITLTNYVSGLQTGDLIIQSTFKRSATIVQVVKPIRIPINFTFSPAFPTMTGCSTMSIGGEWMLGGNAATVSGTDYLGTSDDVPLNFRVNAQPSGKISSAGSTYFGYQSGKVSTTGINTAFGANSLLALTNGGSNTAFGWETLKASNGSGSTAIGHAALRMHTSGINTAVGMFAMAMTASGNANTCMGYSCMLQLTTGAMNTGIGASALNGAVGAFSGSDNIGIGYNAGFRLSSGIQNTFIGNNAGSGTAPNAITTGSNNIFIGHNAHNTAGNVSNELFIDSTNPAIPLIGGNFSTRNVTMDGTVNINGTGSIALKLKTGHAIRTQTAAVADVVYFDVRTLFRDGASGGSGFVGIAGGLGVGGGSYWTVAPAAGNVQIQGQVGIGTLTPGVPLTPVVATAGVVKLHVTGGETILDQEAWIPIPMEAGWAACSWAGSPIPSYFKDSSGIVHFKGCAKLTGAPFSGGGLPFFIPPVGYKPDGHGSFIGGQLYRTGLTSTCLMMVSFTSFSIAPGPGQTFATNDICHFGGLSYKADS